MDSTKSVECKLEQEKERRIVMIVIITEGKGRTLINNTNKPNEYGCQEEVSQ